MEAPWIGNPPEDTREVLDKCVRCDEEIRSGDTVIFFLGETYCSDECVDEVYQELKTIRGV